MNTTTNPATVYESTTIVLDDACSIEDAEHIVAGTLAALTDLTPDAQFSGVGQLDATSDTWTVFVSGPDAELPEFEVLSCRSIGTTAATHLSSVLE